MMAIRFILSLLFSIVIAIFAIQNASIMEVKFLSFKAPMSQALVILISAIAGGVIVLLLGIVKQIKLGLKVNSSTKTIERLEKENQDLKHKVEELTNLADSKPVELDKTLENLENKPQ